MTYVPVKTDTPLMEAIKDAIVGNNEHGRYARRVMGEAGPPAPISVPWAQKVSADSAKFDAKHAIQELQGTIRAAQEAIKEIQKAQITGSEEDRNLWIALRMASTVALVLNIYAGDVVSFMRPFGVGNFDSANAARLIERLDRQLDKLR